MKTADGYPLIAKFAGLPDDKRRREEMLGLARCLSGESERCAAILWLYDAEKACFRLDHYEPMDPNRQLARVLLPCPPEVANDESRCAQLIANESRVAQWLRCGGFGPHREVFRFVPIHGSACYLEAVTRAVLSEDATTLLRSLAEVISARIARQRARRRLSVYEQLTTLNLRASKQYPLDDSPPRWFKVAAEAAREATSADFAVVFSEAPDLSLRAMATDPPADLTGFVAASHSLTRKVYENGLKGRILDHTDASERGMVFGTTEFDKQVTERIEGLLRRPLRSWIAVAVECDDEPLAVLLVANKRPDQYLPEVFSGTDFELVKAISQVVSRGLAQSQTNLAIRKISDFTFAHEVRSADERQRLLALVQQCVPGIVAGVVSLRYHPDDPPAEVEVWPLGELEPGAEKVLNEHARARFRTDATPRLVPLPTTPGSGKHIYYVYQERLRLGGGDRLAVMHLLSRRPHLAKHQRDVLGYLNADLGQIIRSELMARRQVEDLTQIRHALRSGLQGVSHIDTAWEVYEQIARRGLQPSDFRVAMLRKALGWTKLFAERCRNLLEESRFLLGQIRAEQLRLGGASIVSIVAETIRCLGPDAEDRDIEIVFQNSSRGDEPVLLDHLLISIAVFNVIDNAIKYSHRHQRVYVSLTLTTYRWTLAVTDRGVHIRPEDREAIFRSFVRRPTGQAQSTRPGTGLGLAVVKQVIDAHGGTITVESEPLYSNKPDDGAQTTFTISVPRQPPRPRSET